MVMLRSDRDSGSMDPALRSPSLEVTCGGDEAWDKDVGDYACTLGCTVPRFSADTMEHDWAESEAPQVGQIVK